MVFPHEYSAEDIMSMLIEEGTEVSYDGVYISEKYSEDGNIHYISSNEEYVSYLIKDNEVLFDHITRKWYRDQERVNYVLKRVKEEAVTGLYY